VTVTMKTQIVLSGQQWDFFKSSRIVVLILELYHGTNDRYVDFNCKQR